MGYGGFLDEMTVLEQDRYFEQKEKEKSMPKKKPTVKAPVKGAPAPPPFPPKKGMPPPKKKGC